MPKYHIDFEAIAQLPPGEREHALALAEEMIRVQRRNPLEGYNPFLQQAMLHSSHAPTRAFFGGNRAGKTTSGVVDDLFEVTPRELIPAHLQRWKRPEWKCPRYLRVGNVSTREINTIIAEKFREWTPKALFPKGGWAKAYSKFEYMLRLECGCTIQFLSYEMDREKWGGSSLHRMHFDEEPPEELYEEGAARLVDFNGDELFSMTPLLGMTWMFDRIWLAGETDPDIYTVVASMLDNPNLSPEGVKRAMAKYAGSPEMLAARIYGHFVHFGGLVYPAWASYRVPTVDRDLIRSCDIVVGIDPGARNFGLSWNAFDGFNNQIQFASELISGEPHSHRPGDVHAEGANVDHAVRKIREVNARWGLEENKIDFIIDPAARARTPTSSTTVEGEFQNLGINVQHGQTDRETGVLLIRRRGKYGAFVTVNIEGNEAAQWEAQRYRLNDRGDGKFDVIKEHDHVMDGTRYAAMHRPWDPPPSAKLAEQLGIYADDVARPPQAGPKAVHPCGALT